MPRLRHPRAVFLFRVALYLATTITLAALLFAGVGFLGFLTVAGVTAALLDVGVGGAILPVGALWTLVFVALGGIVVLGARRVERTVVEYDREPDPLEALKRRYVEADIDEPELEHRLEAVLDGDDPAATRESDRTERAARSRAARRGWRALLRRPHRRGDEGERTSLPLRE
jgi:uncharacterized membrane protein